MGSLRNLVAATVTRKAPALLGFLTRRSAKGVRVHRHDGRIELIRDSKRQMIRISSGCAVYSVHIAECFDYYFSSVKPIVERRHGTDYAVIDFSSPRHHEVIGFSDFPVLCPTISEPYITTQQYLDFARLKPGDVALDLGAYAALTSITFSKAVGPTGLVVALEPDPANHCTAVTNIETHEQVNGLENIRLMKSAVGDKRGVLRFSSEGCMGSADVSVVGDYRGNVIEVECITLQEIVEQNELDRVDFVKIDIEGSEVPVLSAASEFFARFKPRLIIEPHYVNGKVSTGKVVELLEGYGYRCELIDQTGIAALPLITAEPISEGGRCREETKRPRRAA